MQLCVQKQSQKENELGVNMQKMNIFLFVSSWHCLAAVVFNDRLLRKKTNQSGKKEVISKRQFIPAVPIYGYGGSQGNIWQQWSSPSVSKPYVDTRAAAPFANVHESQENIDASYKGLSYYAGSNLDNRVVNLPPGFPVALEVDKERGNFDEEEEEFEPKSSKSLKGNERGGIEANLTTYVQYVSPPVPKQSTTTTPLSTTTTTPLTTTTPFTTTTSTPSTTGTSTTPNVEFAKDSQPKGIVCYLPRIVVNTRLVGYTVINEVKIYTNPRDESSAHSFVSSHEVSDAASKVTHEFALPPEFVIEKPISKADMKFYNKVPVMITSASVEGNQPIGAKTSCHNQPCPKNTPLPTGSGPTFNPYLPTANQEEIPMTSSTTHVTTTKVKNNFPTSSLHTTTTTTTSTPAPKSTSTVKSFPTAIIVPSSLTILKQVKKRVTIEQLNHAARHRNALFDVPGGDSAALSGYQILGPPDVQQMWVKTKK